MADSSTSESYQPLIAVKDKNFNVADVSQYHLSICVNETYFKVSCVNPTTKQCLLLEVYNLAYENTHRRLQAIEQLYRDHPFLAAGNWFMTTLCIGNQQYTLLPKQFVRERDLSKYLKFTCPIGLNKVKHFTHSTLNVTVAFAMDTLLLNWFQTTYKQTRFYTIHQASSVIENTFSYPRNDKSNLLPKMLVFVEKNHLHTTVIQNRELLYYNRFKYTNSNELLQYILIVMNTLRLNTSFHEVILGGSIIKSSLAYKKACNYIRKLTFSSKPPYLKFKSIFKKEIVTTHLDVLSTHLCHQELYRE